MGKGVLQSTLVNVLHEFDVVLERSTGLAVCTAPIAGSLDRMVEDGGPIEFITDVRLDLQARKALTIDLPLVEKAANADELLRFIVDRHYKPIEEMLKRAGPAALTAWEAVVNG